MSRWLGVTLVMCSVVLQSPLVLRAQRGPDRGEWRAYAGDTHSMKYSALSQINKDNIDRLHVVWRSPVADRAIQENPQFRAGRFEETPLMANGVLYTVSGLGLISALDPATGETLWVYNNESYKAGAPPNAFGWVVRGMGYWTDGKAERLFHATNDAYIVSVDAKTGKADPAFGENGRVDLTAGIRDAKRIVNFAGRPPLVAGDVVVAGNLVRSGAPNKEMPPGDVKGFDARTGKLLWTFHVVPRSGEFGYETWLEGSAEYSGNANVWGGISYDPELDYVYFPTTSPTNDHHGGLRLGDNLFGDSIVCVEAKTGKRVWHFQAIHHNLWDWEMSAAPILATVTVEGRRVKALFQTTKHGFLYAFDRKTGKPLWPIEERPVGSSSVPREHASPVQPFPTKPLPFERQGATEDNLIDFTPALRATALQQLQLFEHGPLFTPPSLKGTLILPGMQGGANWGGAAFDPDTGIVYVPSIMAPSVIRLVQSDPTRTNNLYQVGGRGPGGEQAKIEGLPIFKPPYSRVTAIDMNKGEHVWMKPLGNGPRNHPLLKDLNLPPLGDRIGGVSALATKTLLFVTTQYLNTLALPEAQPPGSDPDVQRKLIYVFDKQTGANLRVIELDGGMAAAPMTYMHKGKQYVVVAVGAGMNSELVALGL